MAIKAVKFASALFVFLTLSLQLTVACGLAQQSAPAPAETLEMGERMYRFGILPSGGVMKAFIREDVEVDSTAFSCASCHLRAGLGSVEGGVITPPTTGTKLYQPYRRPKSLENISDRQGRDIYANTLVARQAYTRETLAKALRFGIDPSGNVFNNVMPRYPLSDTEMDTLISYLESLSSKPSPGASVSEFRFATIITDDVGREDRQALLEPLNNFISQKNRQLDMYNDFKRFGYAPTPEMRYAFRRASLDIWELKGEPETWPKQLSAYYERNPVFAVLGGISNRDWRTIHDFCEARRLPCLFPITDLPVVSSKAWYTYYFNKGYYQEGEGAALYLNRLERLPADAGIVQIVQESPAGKALAAGFEETWQELGRPPVITAVGSKAQLGDQDYIRKILEESRAGLVLLWTDAVLPSALPRIAEKLAAPGMLFVSSGYLGREITAIPEIIREKLYITFPYRLTTYTGPKTGGYDSKLPAKASARDFGNRRISSRTTTMLQQIAAPGLNLIYDNLYRDHLLDVMSMQMDVIVRDYERLSFGPGQRYASKGCYVIQLGPGENPALLPRSEWVIH